MQQAVYINIIIHHNKKGQSYTFLLCLSAKRPNSDEIFISYLSIFTNEKQAKISPTFPVNLNLPATRSDPLLPKGSK